MKLINGQRFGTTLNLSIDGKLIKKTFESIEKAKDVFSVFLDIRNNPTDENIKRLYNILNDRMRIAMEAGLEADPETGEVFLAGFNTPIPDTLVDIIKEYNDNEYPMDAIINFWKFLMLDPDKRVRSTLFDFIKTHDFVLTDKGYMVVYKAVYYKNKVDNDLAEFVSNQYLRVKKDWKCNPNNYVVYRDVTDKFGVTKIETAQNWVNEGRNIDVLGSLGKLNANFDSLPDEKSVYTDMYSQTMTIKLGEPVAMERSECDGDPAKECSYGLHVGSTRYVSTFAHRNSVILVCLVNPMNVIAVPEYDNSKMRVSEYFPFALATFTDGKIDIIEQKYFENDYCNYDAVKLEEMAAKIIGEELPIKSAKNAEPEDRSMSELMKIIENRMIDIF
jgi:hypothetical protein